MAKKAGKSPKRSSPRAAARRRATSTKRQAGAGRKRSARQAPAKKRPAAKTARKAAKPASKAKKRAAPAKKAAPTSKKHLKKAPKAAASKAAAPRAAAPKKAAPVKRPRPVADTRRPVHPLSLDRNRRHLPELEDNVPTPPSSLDLDRTPSAARSGRMGMASDRLHHNETSPELTGGDVDANWENGYAVGDESPGGDNPTPDQDRVDDIGKALGVQYNDDEELKAADKIIERDRHRWELDPASAEDYPEHDE
jgi:Family of unknown function (DUF6335)